MKALFTILALVASAVGGWALHGAINRTPPKVTYGVAQRATARVDVMSESSLRVCALATTIYEPPKHIYHWDVPYWDFDLNELDDNAKAQLKRMFKGNAIDFEFVTVKQDGYVVSYKLVKLNGWSPNAELKNMVPFNPPILQPVEI
jgi:hypothetical protein